MTIYYFDLIGGNNANDGLSFANRKQFPALFSDISAGNEIRFMKTPDPIDLGISATWSNTSSTASYELSGLSLGSLIKTVWASPDTTMFGVTNTTVSRDTSVIKIKAGASTKIIVGSAFTTGKLAYYYFGGTSRNYSGFNGLTFWIRSSAVIAANTLRFNLCSDNNGDTTVYSFTLNKPINLTNGWCALTIPYGSTIGDTAINSFSITALTDPGIPTINIAGITVCNTDKLSYTNLIGANTTDFPFWFVPQELNSTIGKIYLTNSDPSVAGSYFSYTGSLYSKQTVDILLSGVQNANATDSLFNPNYAPGPNPISTEAMPAIISGGWNSTDMSTQTGDTAIDFTCQSQTNGAGLWYDSSSTSAPHNIKINSFTFSNGHSIAFLTNVETFKISNCNIIDSAFVLKGTISNSTYTVISELSFTDCTLNFAGRKSTNCSVVNILQLGEGIKFKNCKINRFVDGPSLTGAGSGFYLDNVKSYCFQQSSTSAPTGLLNTSLNTVPIKQKIIFKNVVTYGGYQNFIPNSNSDIIITDSVFNDATQLQAQLYLPTLSGHLYCTNSIVGTAQPIIYFTNKMGSCVFINCNNTTDSVIFKSFGKLTKLPGQGYLPDSDAWRCNLSNYNGSKLLNCTELVSSVPNAIHKLGSIPVVAGKLITATIMVLRGQGVGKVGLSIGPEYAIFDTYIDTVWCDEIAGYQLVTLTCTPARDGIFEPHVCFSHKLNEVELIFSNFTCTQAD